MPYPPSAALVEDLAGSLRAVAAGLHRYPDREAGELRAGLAGYLGVRTEQVWAANGSNEILTQLLQAFGGPGHLALGFTPSYSMHPIIAALTGTGWQPVDRDANFEISAAQAVAAIRRYQPQVVVLTRPNNPTGTAMPLELVEAVCAAAPGLVIVDEAYAEFSAQPSAIGLLPRCPQLVVTRTMSKAFAFAGGRLGYLATSPAVVQALALVRLPYHLSALTQAAALAALRHAQDTLGAVHQVIADRDRLADQLRSAGWRVLPSDANFLLFGRFADAGAAWRQLAQAGVLVRDVGIEGHLRVTVGTSSECAAFLAALAEVSR